MNFENHDLEAEWIKSQEHLLLRKSYLFLAATVLVVICNRFQFEVENQFVVDYFFYFQIGSLSLSVVLIKLFPAWLDVLNLVFFLIWQFFVYFPFYYLYQLKI